MGLTNAERQARLREKRKAEALQRINECGRLRDKALVYVAMIDMGQRYYTAKGDRELCDYTDELRAEKLNEARQYQEFIHIWRRDAGQ